MSALNEKFDILGKKSINFLIEEKINTTHMSVQKSFSQLSLI